MMRSMPTRARVSTTTGSFWNVKYVFVLRYSLGWRARDHRPLQSQRRAALDLVDRRVRIDRGNQRKTDETTLAARTELEQPVVVGADARELVVAVLRLRERHADRRIQHLRGHAV